MAEEEFSSVLRKSVIFATLISGIFFTIKSMTNPSVTGAYIGTSSINPYISLGIGLLLVALAFSYHHDKHIFKQ